MTGYKGRTKRGFELPDVINPGDTVCVQFRIPNAPEYRRAVLGWVHELGKWYLWEKTAPGDTRAKEAAQLFRLLLLTSMQIADECGSTEMPFQLRQNSENKCLLEQSLDGGVNWTPAFDYSLCGKGAPLVRFTEDDDMEVSYDNGATWTPATTEDPRLTAPPFQVLDGEDGDAKRCEAARNAAAFLKAGTDELITQLIAGAGLAAIMTLIGSIILIVLSVSTAGLLAPLAIALATSALTIGGAALDAAFTASVWEDILCIFYCNFGQDGTVDETQFEIIKAEIEFQIGGVAAFHLIDVMNIMGLIGFNNASRVPQDEFTGDCTECLNCSCDPSCHPVDNYDVQFNAQANISGDDSKWSGGWGFRVAGTYGRVYGVLYSFSIDIGADVCVAGVQVWGGGGSDNSWAGGYDVYLDGQYYGSLNTALNNIFQAYTWGGSYAISPATKKHGRHLQFVAKPPITGNLTTDYGMSIKAVMVRYCNLGG